MCPNFVSVLVLVLLVQNTYEAEMFLRSSKKLGLDHALLTNLEVGRGALEEGDAHDINKLLRLGAYGVFDEDDSAARTFQEANIDDILKTRAKVIKITQPKESEEGENGEEGIDGSPAPAAAAASSSQVIAGRLNYNKMTFESSGSSSQLAVDDPDFWKKLAPMDDSERYSPAQLLSQLTDNSAVESDKSRADFYRFLSACTERILRLKRAGEDVASIDDLQSLLIQFAATTAFPEAQRAKARSWLEEAERRVERKVRSKTFPLTSAVPRRTTAKQRGAMAGIEEGNDGAYREVEKRSHKKGAGSKFGRITNVNDDSEDSGDSGSDFGGGGGARDDDEDEDEDPEAEDTTGGRRVNKQRVARGLKRRKGLLNLDICEICNQSGRLLACDGPCQGWYHLACAGLAECPADNVEWVCKRCVDKKHPCHACHEEGVACEPGSDVPGGVNKCSISTCGRYYHIPCIKKYPIAFFYENSNRFRCALHYCAGCAVPGDSQSMIHVRPTQTHTSTPRKQPTCFSFLSLRLLTCLFSFVCLLFSVSNVSDWFAHSLHHRQ